MRPLTEEESKAVFTKLANYIVRTTAHAVSKDLQRFSPGKKPGAPYRQTRRAPLLQTTKGPCILCLRVIHEARYLCRPSEPYKPGDLFWQVFEEWQVQASYHRIGFPCAVRQVQGAPFLHLKQNRNVTGTTRSGLNQMERCHSCTATTS